MSDLASAVALALPKHCSGYSSTVGSRFSSSPGVSLDVCALMAVLGFRWGNRFAVVLRGAKVRFKREIGPHVSFSICLIFCVFVVDLEIARGLQKHGKTDVELTRV